MSIFWKILVSCFSRKQNSFALSTIIAEYIAAGSCIAQILWMIQQLNAFGFNFKKVPVKFDNNSAILVKNHVRYSIAKNIEVRYHFTRELVTNEYILLEHVDTSNQMVNIFTKLLCEERFIFIRELGLSNLR